MPFYKSDTTSPEADDAFALVGSAFEADNLVPTAIGCSTTDRMGLARPQSGAFCDAGAHER